MTDMLNEQAMVNGEIGWVCPKCGRIYAPTVTQCPYCKTVNDKCSTSNFEDLEPNQTSNLTPLNS